MSIKATKGEKVFYAINYIVIGLIGLATVYPMLYVVFASFSDPVAFSKVDGLLFAPAGFSIEGYIKVFENSDIWTGYVNTLFYVIVGTAISMIITIVSAYILSRKFMLRKPLMLFIMFTMFFCGGMIPSYLLVQSLKMTDTVWAILIPTMVNTWNLIILRSYFESIPNSLIEAARIDGTNELQLIIKIIIPLSKAALATITLFYAVAKWNEWFSSVLYLRDRSLYPLQMFLRETLIITSAVDYDKIDIKSLGDGTMLLSQIIKYATVIVSTVPILLVYPFLQKYFAKGVMIGAVKG